MSKDIFVIVEQRNGAVQKVSYELIGEATKLSADLGEQVVAVLLGHKIADKAEALIQYGASKVLVVDHPVLENYHDGSLMSRPSSTSSRTSIRTSFSSAQAPSAATWRPASRAASTPA